MRPAWTTSTDCPGRVHPHIESIRNASNELGAMILDGIVTLYNPVKCYLSTVLERPMNYD